MLAIVKINGMTGMKYQSVEESFSRIETRDESRGVRSVGPLIIAVNINIRNYEDLGTIMECEGPGGGKIIMLAMDAERTKHVLRNIKVTPDT